MDGRTGMWLRASMMPETTAMLPCAWSSTTSSPVKLIVCYSTTPFISASLIVLQPCRQQVQTNLRG